MDQTARLLRRTVWCAFWCCPLAVAGLWAPLLLQTALTLSACHPAAPWYARRSAPLRRAAATLLPSLALAAGLYGLLRSSMPAIPLRIACFLTGCAAQAGLISALPRPGKRVWAACALAILAAAGCWKGIQ